MRVTAGHTVRIEYELKVKGGPVLESSQKNGPLEYVHGEHRLLPALERHLEGMAVGEDKAGEIPAAEAFGDESSLPTMEMLKKEFPADEKLTVGRAFVAKAHGKDAVRFRIVAIDGEKIKVRLLHELSDRDIEFRVKILGIEPPRARRTVLRPPPPPAAALGIDTSAIEVVSDDKPGD
jgi:FKBP-type peptidyl-prolyl cis-trans isomerase 2